MKYKDGGRSKQRQRVNKRKDGRTIAEKRKDSRAK